MSLERMTVSLDDFVKYLLEKWKIIVVSVLLGAVFSAVLTNMLGEKIVIPPSEEYFFLKEQEASFEDYVENSVIMKMDSMNIFERALFIDNISDRNALKDYIESGEIWDESTQTVSTKYLTELVSWEEYANLEGVELKVRHSEAPQCGEFAEYIAEQIQLYDKNIQVTVGVQKTVMDESVSDAQMWYLNRLNDVKGQLEYTTAGCTIEVTAMSAIILGVLAGGLLVTVVLFGKFLFNDKLRSIDEIEYYTGAKIFGKNKGVKGQKIIPEVGTAAFEDLFEEMIEEQKNIILVNLTGKKLCLDKIEEVCGIENAEELEKILSSDKILLAAAANKTVYKELKKVLKFLEENEKEIYGCIAC